MKIVLLERINKLGQMGDIVDVRSGYARNFLLPQKYAVLPTKANLEMVEQKKQELLKQEEILKNEENFYNFIYGGSLFNSKKIITIYEATDKIIQKISDFYDKYPENIFLIIQ